MTEGCQRDDLSQEECCFPFYVLWNIYVWFSFVLYHNYDVPNLYFCTVLFTTVAVLRSKKKKKSLYMLSYAIKKFSLPPTNFRSLQGYNWPLFCPFQLHVCRPQSRQCTHLSATVRMYDWTLIPTAIFTERIRALLESPPRVIKTRGDLAHCMCPQSQKSVRVEISFQRTWGWSWGGAHGPSISTHPHPPARQYQYRPGDGYVPGQCICRCRRLSCCREQD